LPAEYFLEKHWPSADEPKWTLTIDGTVIDNLSTATLLSHSKLWRRVALATELRVYFPVTSRAEHGAWLRPLLAGCPV